MRSCWSTKSKSIAKPGWVPGWSMGRVVMPPAGEVEGQVPPVVAPHADGQPDLPDDLAEPVQRGLGVLPFGQRHRWEQLHACTLRSRALSTPDIPPVCLASAMLSSRRR
jgi:hypothetical protein